MAVRNNTYMRYNLDSAGAGVALTQGVHTECSYSVQDTSANGPTEISAGPAILYGVFVNTVLSAHTVIFKDAATSVITLPASLAAGTFVNFSNGIRFETSLQIDPDDSSTGNVTVFYKPL